MISFVPYLSPFLGFDNPTTSRAGGQGFGAPPRASFGYDFTTDLEIVTKQYEQATQAFLRVAEALADSEAQSYARLRRLIVEEGTLIQG
jgi:hypothetical protein